MIPHIQFFNKKKYFFYICVFPMSWPFLANFELAGVWLGQSIGHIEWISYNRIHPRLVWPTIGSIGRLSWILGRSNQTTLQLTAKAPSVPKASWSLSVWLIHQKWTLTPQSVHLPHKRGWCFSVPASGLVLSSPLRKRWTWSIAASPRSVLNDILQIVTGYKTGGGGWMQN